MTNWMDDAHCRTRPWHALDLDAQREVCDGCPVRTRCLEWGRETLGGLTQTVLRELAGDARPDLWGGRTFDEIIKDTARCAHDDCTRPDDCWRRQHEHHLHARFDRWRRLIPEQNRRKAGGQPMSTRQPPLPPAPRAHQLPPKWDGCTTEWGEWHIPDSSMRFHGRPECCPRCGSITERALNVGKLRADGPRVFLARRARSGYQPGRLFAWRCPDCKLDQVTDLSGVVWDLDDDDYTDEGSYAR